MTNTPGTGADGYGVEQHEVDAVVRALLSEILAELGDVPDLLGRYHELTRLQRLWEAVGPRVVTALVAERGHLLRQTGLTQEALREPTGLGTRQRVGQIMRAADRRDPVAVAIQESAG